MKLLALIGIITNAIALALPPYIPGWLVTNGVCLVLSILTYCFYDQKEEE